jgi:hypothetical protein
MIAPPGSQTVPVKEPTRAAEQNWLWGLLMGLGMFVGGLLALFIASTRVVLPYDEQFVGLTRAQLISVNAHLIPFMAHDRVTLAGTMLTIGVLYCGLSLYGLRRGLHWAQVTLFASAFVGFGTFFLFLGFGYFDPFHAFVTAILFQFLLLALHSHNAQAAPPPPPNLHNDAAWRRSLWAQLLFVTQAMAFTVAGLVISGVGVTSVFVPEDLEFLATDPGKLTAAAPQLVALVAHDRATFGGMLLAAGLAFLMIALWGFRQGERWIWWTMLLAGIPGYAAAIAVHFAVGYENLWHLTPAFVGLGIFVTAQLLSYSFFHKAECKIAGSPVAEPMTQNAST